MQVLPAIFGSDGFFLSNKPFKTYHFKRPPIFKRRNKWSNIELELDFFPESLCEKFCFGSQSWSHKNEFFPSFLRKRMLLALLAHPIIHSLLHVSNCSVRVVRSVGASASGTTQFRASVLPTTLMNTTTLTIL